MNDSLIQNSEISNLNPIFIPEPVLFESVTIGWYILASVFLLLALFIIYRLINKWRKNTYRRLAIDELNQIIPSLHQADTRRQTLQQISTLVKRVAIKSYSRSSVASLYGRDWINFLSEKNKRTKIHSSTNKILAEEIYRSPDSIKNISQEELNVFASDVKMWIGGHRV